MPVTNCNTPDEFAKATAAAIQEAREKDFVTRLAVAEERKRCAGLARAAVLLWADSPHVRAILLDLAFEIEECS